MSDDAQTPELIRGFMGWVAHNPNYGGLWRYMGTPGSAYTVADFKQELWLVWLETGDVELSGDVVIDARTRGLFSVLNRIDYWYRKRRLVSIDSPIGDGDGGALVDVLESSEPPPKFVAVSEYEDRAITRRWVIRQLVSVKTERDLAAFQLTAPPNPVRLTGGTSTPDAYVALSRRNWWRLMNL